MLKYNINDRFTFGQCRENFIQFQIDENLNNAVKSLVK